MNKFLSVVFLVIFSFPACAINLASAIDDIEREWAAVYYKHNHPNPSAIYQKLLTQAQTLGKQFPTQAEPLLWQAILVATDANHQSPIKALEHINIAHDLLMCAIALDPSGVSGAVQVTLGTLYYMAPGWPIAFGDTEKAEQYFLAALKINPDSIEANYFYGDFLIANNKAPQAQSYLQKAITIPPRKQQLFSDQSLQHQATLALNNLDDHILNPSKKILLSRSNHSRAN